MRLLLQFPEGLKQKALAYAKKYEEQGHEVFLSASPCYGACDIALDEAKAVGAKKIVHFGHARFVTRKLPVAVEYVEYKLDFDLDLLFDVLQQLKQYKKIAIGTTVQYAHKIDAVKKILRTNGFIPLTGKGTAAIYEAQVLGCDAVAVTRFEKEADAILFIGDGKFHYLAIDSDKPVFVFHPKSGKLERIDAEIAAYRKKRKGALLRAVDAKTFGIILSTKLGQFNLKLAEWVKKELIKRGKTAEILVANEIEPVSLNNFMAFECYVTTACPRLAEDREEFTKPVLDMLLFKEYLRVIDELNK
jgi:2-(3-amino-3-carboxypropyl)histidine synthase